MAVVNRVKLPRFGFESQQPQDFSLVYNVQTGTGAQWVPGSIYPGVNRPGHKVDHSPPFSADVNNGGAIPPLPNVRISSWHSA
jgi:hypothetical protein